MAGIGSSLSTQQITDVKITNLTLTLANTEYSHSLVQSCKSIEIAARGNSKLKISFISGQSGVVYKTIPKNTSYELSIFNFSSKTLYIQSDISGDIVEIVELF